MLPCDNIFAGLITNIMRHIILFLIRNVLHEESMFAAGITAGTLW